MPFLNGRAICLASLLALTGAASAQTVTAPQGIVPDTIEGHLVAGKNLAGGRDNTPDFYGLVTAICVAPQRGAPLGAQFAFVAAMILSRSASAHSSSMRK